MANACTDWTVGRRDTFEAKDSDLTMSCSRVSVDSSVLMSALKTPALSMRLCQAAGLLAALAAAEPSSAARLLRDRLAGLEDAALKAAAVCGPEPPSVPSQVPSQLVAAEKAGETNIVNREMKKGVCHVPMYM